MKTTAHLEWNDCTTHGNQSVSVSDTVTLYGAILPPRMTARAAALDYARQYDFNRDPESESPNCPTMICTLTDHRTHRSYEFRFQEGGSGFEWNVS